MNQHQRCDGGNALAYLTAVTKVWNYIYALRVKVQTKSDTPSILKCFNYSEVCQVYHS
jgi:hypothetical protein